MVTARPVGMRIRSRRRVMGGTEHRNEDGHQQRYEDDASRLHPVDDRNDRDGCDRDCEPRP